MTFAITRSAGVLSVVALSALLAACSPTSFGRSAPAPTVMQPAQSAPIQTSSVQASDLPPIGGATVAPVTVQPSINPPLPGNTTQGSFGSGQQVGANGQMSGIGAVDAGPGNTMGGRDLSGGLTIEKLLGGWTIISGADQCRLNLTYTAKGATGRYRASTPACTLPTLAAVTSWQLLGNQIHLYNEADEIVGTLLRSGDRFVGTLAGGQAISMVG